MLEQGLVQVYTGKTELVNLAHLGLCLRATGQGLRTFIMGFAPHPLTDIEDRALSYLKPYVVVERVSLSGGSHDEQLKDKVNKVIHASIGHIKDILIGGGFDIIILEEVNNIVDRGVVPVESITNLIGKKPTNIELVLTGSNAKDEIIEVADLVTEMVVHKAHEGLWAISDDSEEGYVEVITGNGKGKTTHCLAKAMLFAASGALSSVLQFIKSPHAYGEVIAIEGFPNLEIKTMGEGFIIGPTRPSKKHMRAARHAWEECLREIFSLKYRLVVLDEINIATHLGLVHPERVREMMFLKPGGMHMILSGRNARPEMMENASAVFEMREIKHPFQKGMNARRGIEY